MASLEVASLRPGNTILAEAKARDWQITLNEVERWDALLSYLTSLKSLTYIIACIEEAPSTGHKHIHAYTQFKNSIKLSIKKMLRSAYRKMFWYASTKCRLYKEGWKYHL